jgi:hypothetical protein
LQAQPGERIAGLAHRGDAALAMIATPSAIRGRWIGDAAWGGETAPLPILAGDAALSPDLARIAAPSKLGISVVTLATGRVVEHFKMLDINQNVVEGRPIAYIDATHLAVTDGNSLRYWDGRALGEPMGSEVEVPQLMAVGADRAVVWARGEALAIGKPDGVAYLGYRMPIASSLVAIDHGFRVNATEQIERLDEQFVERKRFDLPPDSWSAEAVDANTALAIVTGTGNARDLVAFDLESGARTIVVRGVAMALSYLAETRMYAVIARDRVLVGRYAPEQRAFEGPVEIPMSRVDMSYVTAQIALSDRGNLLTIVEPVGGQRATVTTISDVDFATGAVTISGLGTQVIVDQQFTHELGLDVSAHATNGRLVAELHDGRITLRDASESRWTIAARGITQLAWTQGGELVGLGNGLAYLDLATGALERQQCGWRFGLGSDALGFASASGTVCDD